MLYNLVAKEFMITRYLKRSKIILAVTAVRSILPGSTRGCELLLATSKLLLAAHVLTVELGFRWLIHNMEVSLARDAWGGW